MSQRVNRVDFGLSARRPVCPPIATTERKLREVAFVPTTDILVLFGTARSNVQQVNYVGLFSMPQWLCDCPHAFDEAFCRMAKGPILQCNDRDFEPRTGKFHRQNSE